MSQVNPVPASDCAVASLHQDPAAIPQPAHASFLPSVFFDLVKKENKASLHDSWKLPLLLEA